MRFPDEDGVDFEYWFRINSRGDRNANGMLVVKTPQVRIGDALHTVATFFYPLKDPRDAEFFKVRLDTQGDTKEKAIYIKEPWIPQGFTKNHESIHLLEGNTVCERTRENYVALANANREVALKVTKFVCREDIKFQLAPLNTASIDGSIKIFPRWCPYRTGHRYPIVDDTGNPILNQHGGLIEVPEKHMFSFVWFKLVIQEGGPNDLEDHHDPLEDARARMLALGL
jgi:hypothetical protein